VIGKLGKCSICGKDAGALYPLLPGSPAFCHNHHNPRDAGPFGCDFTGPDDFDIPIEGYGFREPILTRREFRWTDVNGNEHKLQDIDDYYLNNIINFLKRKSNEIFDSTIKFLEREANRRLNRK